MKTMYYLESETRQKLADFHKEKAICRLGETATESRSSNRPFQLLWTAVVQLAHMPQRLLHLGRQRHEHSIKLEHSLDKS